MSGLRGVAYGSEGLRSCMLWVTKNAWKEPNMKWSGSIILAGLMVACGAVPVAGKKLAEYKLESPPVWDGMIAANGRLFLSLTNGKLECWAEK